MFKQDNLLWGPPRKNTAALKFEWNVVGDAWQILILIAVPIAGFVGFIMHLLAVKKSRLEIKKLRNELARQEREEQNKGKLIKVATFEQIREFMRDEFNSLPTLSPSLLSLRAFLLILIIAIIINIAYYYFFT